MMTADILATLPAREGHFRLESGYHTDLWLTLDAIFVRPRDVAPHVGALADKLRPHDVSAVCGPFLGGAFLAHALATTLGVDFYFAEPLAGVQSSRLFDARYRIPSELRRRLSGARVAVVDDVMSAGSSVRAVASAVSDAGGSVAVVGALFVLGSVGLDHFAGRGIPVERLGERPFVMWEPTSCPLCARGAPIEDPVRANGAQI